MKPCFLFWVLLMLLVGCETIQETSQSKQAPNIKYASELTEPINFLGFSIGRPLDNSWYIRKGEITPLSVILRKEFSAKNHSFYALVEFRRLPEHDMTIQIFRSLILRKYLALPNAQVIESKIEEIAWKGAPAIQFSVTYQVTDKQIFFYRKGIAAIHPSLSKGYIVAYYSERGRKSILDGSSTLETNCRTFIDSISFEIQPEEIKEVLDPTPVNTI